MVWVLIILVLIGAVYCVGYFLPHRQTGASEKLVMYTPEQVFAAVMDGQNFPIAADMARSVSALDDMRWREDIGSSTLEVETVEADAPGRVVRHYRDLKLPMTAQTEILIAPAKKGSYVAMQTDITLKNEHVFAPVMRLLMVVFNGADKGVEAYLAQLEKGLNRGLVAPVSQAAE